jgi:hypothetical protein
MMVLTSGWLSTGPRVARFEREFSARPLSLPLSAALCAEDVERGIDALYGCLR